METPEVPQITKVESVKGEPKVALTAEAERIFGSSSADIKETFDGINKSLDEITNEFLKVPKEISMEHAELTAEETAKAINELMQSSIQQLLVENTYMDIDSLNIYGKLDGLIEEVRDQAINLMNKNIQYALDHQPEFKFLTKFENGEIEGLAPATVSDIRDALEFSGLPKVQVIAEITETQPVVGSSISKINLDTFMDRYGREIDQNKGEGIASAL